MTTIRSARATSNPDRHLSNSNGTVIVLLADSSREQRWGSDNARESMQTRGMFTRLAVVTSSGGAE